MNTKTGINPGPRFTGQNYRKPCRSTPFIQWYVVTIRKTLKKQNTNKYFLLLHINHYICVILTIKLIIKRQKHENKHYKKSDYAIFDFLK